MNFASALFSLKRGFKIKRKDWIGYWVLENNKVMMHLKNGTVKNLVDSEDIIFTLENMACDDWEVITDASNVGLPKCPTTPITTTNPAYIQKPRQYEDLKIEAVFNASCGKNTTAEHNHCHTSSCANLSQSTLSNTTIATDEYGRTAAIRETLAREFLMEPDRSSISQNESVNDNGIYAPTNDQPVNDKAINESVNNEPVNDSGIYEHSGNDVQLHNIASNMNAIMINYEEQKDTALYGRLIPKSKCEFCRFDGSKWIPTDSKVASDMQTTLDNYKVCYDVNGKWVPWDKLDEVTK